MITRIEIHLNIYTNIWIISRNQFRINEMKHTSVCRSIKKNCHARLKYKIIKRKSANLTIYDQLQKNKINKYQKQDQQQHHQKKQSPYVMEHNNENQEFFFKYLVEKNKINEKHAEKRSDKGNYLKTYNYVSTSRFGNGNDDNNNFTSITHNEGDPNAVQIQVEKKNTGSGLNDFKDIKKCQNALTHLDGNSPFEDFLFPTYNQYPIEINSNNKSSDNIDREEVPNIIAERNGEFEADNENDNNSETRSNFAAADNDLLNTDNQNKCYIHYQPDKENRKSEKVTRLKTQTTNQQPLAAYIAQQTVATTHVQNITQHLLKDLGHQISHGQQLNVHNLLDVAGSLCAGPTGAFCDMAAFSKLDYSPLGDFKDHTQNNQEFLEKKFDHPLYAHGVCRWPGCELSLDDMAHFVNLL